MPDQLPQIPDDNLTPITRERRDAMLPSLLAEVRRVRRCRTAARIASITTAIALTCGILTLALLRSPATLIQPIAKAPANATPGTATATTTPDPHTPRIEIVQTSPDILDRLSLRAPSLVQVEYINTDQALALLESTGNRYGTIEIAGRVEFQLIAKK